MSSAVANRGKALANQSELCKILTNRKRKHEKRGEYENVYMLLHISSNPQAGVFHYYAICTRATAVISKFDLFSPIPISHDKVFWGISFQVVSTEQESDQQNNTEFLLITTMFLLYKYFQCKPLKQLVIQEPWKKGNYEK